MTAHLHLAKNFKLPLDAVTETLAILGIRGSGKTNTAVVLAEQLIRAGQQVVIIDPTDVWWGLKSSADGKSSGLPVVVLGGRHGDLPLTESDGAAIADFAVEHRASIVLSLRHFESKGAAKRFVTEFCRRLYYRKGQDNATPVMVIFDEASLFVPQRVGGADAALVGAIQQLVRQGRSSGIGVALIDQRGSTVNKDVLDMLELLVCHRTTSPRDRKALTAWIEQHDVHDQGGRFLEQLASLPRGVAWFWSPGWLDVFERVEVSARTTFDSSRTPKAGEKIAEPKTIAAIDLDALRAKMAATLERAKADDPAVLRRRIAELERAARTGVAAEPDAIEAIRVQEYAAGRARERADIARAFRHISIGLAGLLVDFERLNPQNRIRAMMAQVGRDDFAPTSPAAGNGTAPAPERPPVTIRSRPGTPPAARARLASLQPPGPGIKAGQQKIINAMAELRALGVDTPNRTQLGMFAGYNLTGGTGAQHIADLVSAGYVEMPMPGVLHLTAAGANVASAAGAPTSLDELHRRVFAKLPLGQQKILMHLIAIHPREISRADLGVATGYNLTGGTGAQHVADLVNVGAVRIIRPGAIVASELLFPDGL